MTDTHQIVSSESSAETPTFWDEFAAFGECSPGDSVSETPAPALAADEDSYDAAPASSPAPSSGISGFYHGMVNTFWNRDALGLRSFARSLATPLLGEETVASVENSVDELVNHPADAVVAGAETLFPGSGEVVSQSLAMAETTANEWLGVSASSFGLAPMPPLGDYYAAQAATTYTFGFAPSFLGTSSQGKNAGAPPYSFDFSSQTAPAEPLPTKAIPVATSVVSVVRADPAFLVPVTASRPLFFTAPPAVVSNFSFSSMTDSAATYFTTDWDVAPFIRSVAVLEYSSSNSNDTFLPSMTLPAMASAVLSEPVIRDEVFADEVIPNLAAAVATTKAAESTLVASPIDEPQTPSSVAFDFSGLAPQERAQLVAAARDAMALETHSSAGIYFREETKFLFGSDRVFRFFEASFSEEPAVSPFEMAASPRRFERQPSDSGTAVSETREPRQDLVHGVHAAKLAWTFLIATLQHGSSREDRSVFALRDSERFINAAAWMAPRRFGAEASETDAAAEQSDLADLLTRRLETVADTEGAGADGDGSQQAPDWARAWQEANAAAALKTVARRHRDLSEGDALPIPSRDVFLA